MGSHQSAKAETVSWLTPPEVLEEVGGWQSFDLDPCAPPRPWPWLTAQHMNSEDDEDGLAMQWFGRVLLNPPYTAAEIANWLARLADHGRGTAIIFARTETEAFHRQVWERASGLLFLEGRLHFHYPDGRRAKANAGAPTVLCAYGAEDLDRLAACNLSGAFVPLRFARIVAVAGPDLPWSRIIWDWLRSQSGEVSVSDAYRHFARHPKAAGRQHWRPQIRKVLAKVGRRVDRDRYAA